MASLNSVLDIAKTALLANQKAINVTSHNIANANTPGYSRQRATLEAMNPVQYGGVYFGTGVNMKNIERVYDAFQATQLRNSYSNLNNFQTSGDLIKALESNLNDLGTSSVSTRLDAFFNSFQDIANSPSSYAERSVLLSNAGVLAERINNIDSGIRQSYYDLNKQIQSQVKDINSFSTQIAQLNQQITNVEVGGVSANDLRDKRDLLLNNLSSMVDITTRENANGQVDVYVGGGFFLVSGVESKALGVSVSSTDPNLYDVTSNGTVLNNKISGGSLKGIVDSAAYYSSVEDKLNLMAATITRDVNVQHRLGYGLDGSTGVDFFTPLSVYTSSSVNNTGGAVITGGAVTNESLLTLNDYEVRFSTPSSYNVINKSTNAIVTSGAYASGSAISFDGLTFTISDNTGAPAAGDRFSVSVTNGAAQSFGVALTDANKVAAASTAAGVPGDNTNALALAGLKDALAINGSTYGQFYNALVTDVGVKVKEASSNLDAQKKVTQQLEMARESTSGVSMEEEAISLIKLQKSYEAAAKVMSTADKMFDVLLNII